MSEKLICHASGDFSHPFIDGFYLYYFPMCESPTDQCKLTKLLLDKLKTNMNSFLFSVSFPTHDFQAFENEWVEVEVKQPIEYPNTIDFLMDNLSLPEPLKHDNRRDGM